MAVKKNKTASKSPRKKRTRKKNSISLLTAVTLLFVISALVLLILIYYTLVIFPARLSTDIKKDLVTLYHPLLVKENGGVFLIKLKDKPAQEIQQKVYAALLDHYGIETIFEKIESKKERGINRVSFFRGISRFNETGEVYIYWDMASDPAEGLAESKKYSPEREAKELEAIKKAPSHSPETQQKPSQTGEPEQRTAAANQPTVTAAPKKTPPQKTAPALPKPVKQPVQITSSSMMQREREPKPVKSSHIVIVIDDVGYHYRSAETFLASKVPMTFALIPGLPESDTYYQRITQKGMPLILHVPMEPEKGREYVEKNGIMTDMSDSAVKERLASYIARYPLAIGANNHMGSKAVKDGRIMNAVMEVMGQKQLLWLDSLTTPGSVAEEFSRMQGVRYYERDVFLDNENTDAYVRRALDKLIVIGRTRKYAVGIGHIQSDALIKVLEEYYAKREALHLSFVRLDALP